MANIGIIGWGVVGQAVGDGFRKSPENKIFWYDKYKKGPFTLRKLISESEFIFVCVPTPMFLDNSGIDLSVVNEVVGKIAPKIANTEKVLIIKSTVVPGTTNSYAKKYKNVRFAMNPEFLTEANAFWDFLHPDRTVIGVFSESVAASLSQLYQNLYGPNTKIFISDPSTVEMVKYMSNAFLATKVIFANEMYELCNALDIKYEEVKRMVVVDERIGETHLDVTTLRGFGGKCFPKDVVALLGFAKKKRKDLSILKSVWKKNLKVRKIRDWEEIEGAVNRKKGSRSKSDRTSRIRKGAKNNK